MPKFAANISMLFTELPFLDRFAAAADHGFTGVEYLFPYEHSTEEIATRLQRHKLTQVLFNLHAGNWDQASAGLGIFPAAISEFRASVAQALRYARALDCKRLHCLAGIGNVAGDQRAYRRTYVENLTYAADVLNGAGITLLIEPINSRDMPGYYIDSTAKARDVIESVGAANLGLQYDCYHMQIMEGDLSATIAKNLDVIRHIQIADTPGRNEPGTGEINYTFLLRYLDQIAYDGWVGCEYKPRTSTIDSLAWFKAFSA